MSHRLIDRNEDLRRLRDEGYNIDIHAGYLLLRDVPYVNERREVKRGILVASLDLNGEITNTPSDHTVKFVGEYPCTSDGQPIAGIRHQSGQFRLSEKLTAQYSFSSKPSSGRYANYYEKMKTYASIISAHAAVIDPTATAQTYRVVEPHDEESPFNYIDTASARAEINVITQKLSVEKLAIVGIGGSGSYVLDLLAKTPVKEIHLYDGDKFSSHNAFRAPGAASIDDLHKQLLKVDYFKDIYSRLHRGIVAHGEYVDGTNAESLRAMNCVFLCLDGGTSKKFIVGKLEEFNLPFIDVGMGLYVANEKLGGILRVTTSTTENRQSARARISFAEDSGANEYDKNIQIADLNALNAVLAVIRWKKLRGFYLDQKDEGFTSYTIGVNMLLSEDTHETL